MVSTKSFSVSPEFATLNAVVESDTGDTSTSSVDTFNAEVTPSPSLMARGVPSNPELLLSTWSKSL